MHTVRNVSWNIFSIQLFVFVPPNICCLKIVERERDKDKENKKIKKIIKRKFTNDVVVVVVVVVWKYEAQVTSTGLYIFLFLFSCISFLILMTTTIFCHNFILIPSSLSTMLLCPASQLLKFKKK